MKSAIQSITGRLGVGNALLGAILLCGTSGLCLSAEYKTLMRPGQGEHVLLEVEAGSVVEVTAGGGVFYGGDLGDYTEQGVDLFDIGIVNRGDYMMGFEKFSLTYYGGPGFVTLKIMTSEEASLGDVIVSSPDQMNQIDVPNGYGLRVIVAPVESWQGERNGTLIAVTPGEGVEEEVQYLNGVKSGDLIAGFPQFRMWGYGIFKLVLLNPQAMTLTIEQSDNAQAWETLESKRIEATEAKQFFRARLESVGE
ncbi:hypothetical protein [Haloferula sp. A504]|uniref:hypothetical protein n=1 Tax=Haloferula sp. A504 TaxID=3373601 RepID=UPI0037BE917D